MKIIATSSTIAYRDITQSFKNEKQMALISDDEYNQLDINKNFDFIGDILLTKNIFVNCNNKLNTFNQAA
ncbi:hypothetical protein [Lactobacillus johnsonii]|uniref:hypothetical protein n=2 Tax=Lactobacillus TaxID=1578 RepID=UPI0018DFC8CD|nr:hypothetical protein [Lactobacillus johnsonii]